MKLNKGELLHIGITNLGKEANDLSLQKRLLVIDIIVLLILLFWIVYLLFIIPRILLVLLISIITFFVLLHIYMIPLSIHGIYLNGISSAQHFFPDYLKNKTFQRYQDISKIGYGTSKREGNDFQFLVVYTDNLKLPSAVFNGFWITDDFLDKLENTLKKRCPNAQWEEMKWESIPGWK